MYALNVRSLVSAAAVVALSAACAARPSDTETAGGTVVPMGETQVNVPALPASEIDMLDHMTDPNILDRLVASDSIEIAMAQTARRQSQDPRVLELAGRLLADHSMGLEHDKAIAARFNLSSEMTPGDTSGTVMFRMLDSLNAVASPAAFDRAYLAAQTRLNRQMLAELQILQHVARNVALRQRIHEIMAADQLHLVQVEQMGTDARYINAGG